MTTSPNEAAADQPMRNVVEWVRTAGQRGFYAANTVASMRTAIEQLLSVADGAETGSPEDFLGRLNDLGGRWARKEDGHPRTAQAYIARARRALTDYLSYQKDPVGFRPTNRRKQEQTPANGKTAVSASRRSQRAVSDRPSVPVEPDGVLPASSLPAGVAEDSMDLRPNMRVRVQIPRDLTPQEALRYLLLLAGHCPAVATWIPRCAVPTETRPPEQPVGAEDKP